MGIQPLLIASLKQLSRLAKEPPEEVTEIKAISERGIEQGYHVIRVQEDDCRWASLRV